MSPTLAATDHQHCNDEIARLRRQIEDLESDVWHADEIADENARDTIEAARVKDCAYLDDVARSCHAEYAHPDAFPFCRAVPCADIRDEIESRERAARKRR